MLFTDLFESFDNTSDSLELGDEVLVTYPNQFQGKRGEITGFGRDKAFVIIEIDGREYSMHSSDVERLGNEEDELNEYGSAHDKVTFEVDSENAYNHIMQKYGNVIDWAGDYMTVPTRYWPAVQELAFAAGGDVQEIELSEGAEFGAYYYEHLAQKVFDKYPDLSTKGSADELLDTGWKIAAQDLGVKRANWEFNYDEDFPSDFVSAYAELQRGEQLDELSPDALRSYKKAAVKDADRHRVASNMAAYVGDKSKSDAHGKEFDKRVAGLGRANKSINKLSEGVDTDQLAGMIAARLERLAPNVFTDYGIEFVLEAVRDVAEFYATSDFEELGSSDLGAMARSVVKHLKMREAHMNRGA